MAPLTKENDHLLWMDRQVVGKRMITVAVRRFDPVEGREGHARIQINKGVLRKDADGKDQWIYSKTGRFTADEGKALIIGLTRALATGLIKEADAAEE